MAQGTPNTEENIRALAEQLTETQLKMLMQIGLLRTNGADFVIEAQLAAGQFLINGQPVNELLGNMVPLPTPAVDPDALPETEVRAPASEARVAFR
jgi:uncharacterized protein YdgA (DUF945 family)